ncbi:bacterial luciferase-like protein, partial [Aspergillus steynii IBT 23096]
FGVTHAEGIFVVGLSPHILAPRVQKIRETEAAAGRDPSSVKVFASITPVIGRTREEAQAKYDEALQYASEEGGLVYWCGNTNIDLSTFDPDTEITEQDAGTSDTRVQSLVSNLSYKGDDIPKWTPRNIGKAVALGASGPVPVGTAQEVADEMERWIDIADLDGFNVGHITTPGTWEDVVEFLVPELRRRGRYAPKGESGTMRERVYGSGQSRLKDDHHGSKFKFAVYRK